MTIESEIKEIIKKIDGRAELVCVTKGRDAKSINSALKASVKVIGENKIQDFESKMEDIGACEKHFIGHLQSNKVRKAVKYFDVIESIDSLRVLEKVDSAAGELNKVQKVLLQVNIGREIQKYGLSPEGVGAGLRLGNKLKNIRILGLMCIVPHVQTTRPFFRDMKAIFDKYAEEYELKVLSMGMSGDYIVALEEGSNMVRIGSSIFC
ncbi:YggS family pyridoxal phosphate-dependent enzyme [Candidatus Woesearchaeota archaeon]|nr:YggS family pyridoxal phosphate-dependent enzyme [Candidatus Woesearchaeota archaeon]